MGTPMALTDQTARWPEQQSWTLGEMYCRSTKSRAYTRRSGCRGSTIPFRCGIARHTRCDFTLSLGISILDWTREYYGNSCSYRERIVGPQ
ncbi:hypothetical protein [Delftia acidovorans]|uniref:hypothetical protein n=1 Tax=Delftia acidovorans TaxID=80866 RepID=UPI002FBD72A1